MSEFDNVGKDVNILDLLPLLAEGKQIQGIVAMNDKPRLGQMDEYDQRKLYTKREIPMLARLWGEAREKMYGLHVEYMDRELERTIEIAPGIYLMLGKGTFGPYFYIGVSPTIDPYFRKETMVYGNVGLAVSNRPPKKGDNYKCTIIFNDTGRSSMATPATVQLKGKIERFGKNGAICYDVENAGLAWNTLVVVWNNDKV